MIWSGGTRISIHGKDQPNFLSQPARSNNQRFQRHQRKFALARTVKAIEEHRIKLEMDSPVEVGMLGLPNTQTVGSSQTITAETQMDPKPFGAL